MPGFCIENNPSFTLRPVPSSVFYTYTWEIFSLFVNSNEPTQKIYAREATLPTWVANAETVQGSSLTYKYANDVIWEDCRFTFYDVVADDRYPLIAYLKNWRDLVWTKDWGIGSAEPGSGNGYKRDSIIWVYTGNQQRSVRWTLHGSWPQTIRHGDLTYATSDVKLVEVVASYDWAEELFQ